MKAAVTAVAGAKQGARWVGGLPWARWAGAAQDAWRRFRALPGKVQAGVAAGVVILALVFMWEPLFSPKATILIRCTHDLAAGELTLLAGEKEVHRAELIGSAEKRLGVFRRTQGIYTGQARVPVGEYTLRVRVASADEKLLASRELHGNFRKGEERTLVIVMDGRSGALRVSWD